MASSSWTKTLTTLPLLAFGALLSGCLLSTETRETGASPRAARIAEENLARWNGSAPKAYTYRLFRECLCFPSGWVDIRVEGDSVVALDPVPGRESNIAPYDIVLAPTIPDLLEQIRVHGRLADYSVTGAYDSKLGYPLEVEIAYTGMEPIFDVGVKMRIESVTVH